MGKLIDAETVTRSTELTKKITAHYLTPFIKVDDLLEFIDNLPAAYDIEKVVAALEKEKFDVPNCRYDVDLNTTIDKAIEIVKRGGAT